MEEALRGQHFFHFLFECQTKMPLIVIVIKKQLFEEIRDEYFNGRALT